VAIVLAAEGAKVVVSDIFKEPDGSKGVERVVQEIREAGSTAVANYDGVDKMASGERNILS
jgi:hypothetical protein